MKRLLFLPQLVFVTSLFSQTALNFTVTSTEGFTITCGSPTLSLMATSDYTASPVSCTWTGPGGPYTGSQVVVSTARNYQVLAQVGVLTATQVVHINVNTIAPYSIGNPTFQIVTGTQTTAATITVTTISPTVNLLQSLYSPTGGTAVATSYSVYWALSVGIYTHCTTDQINGCTSCILFTVELQDPTKGVSKIKEEFNSIRIFPNPANDFIQLEISNNNLLKEYNLISIYNNLGQLIREEEIVFKDNSVIFKTSDLENGVYSLRLSNYRGHSSTTLEGLR